MEFEYNTRHKKITNACQFFLTECCPKEWHSAKYIAEGIKETDKRISSSLQILCKNYSNIYKCSVKNENKSYVFYGAFPSLLAAQKTCPPLQRWISKTVTTS